MSVALFVRHGKASAFSSSTDYDNLSPPGIEQSELLGSWLAEEKLPVDAVFVGPRKRHAQTHAAVLRVLATHGMTLPEPVLLPELDEHDGIGLVFKILPSLAAEDPELRVIVDKMAASGRPSPDDVLAAFKRITRRWVRGEIGHEEIESWAAFRARVARAMARMAALGRGKTALVFTSAGAVASAVAEALDVRDEEKVLDLSWSLYNGSITELDFTGERWGMRSFNATPHIRDKRLVTSV
ncbi:MAG TPA: histidine phosphatase family protein [Polyangiaceae bacterium]